MTPAERTLKDLESLDEYDPTMVLTARLGGAALMLLAQKLIAGEVRDRYGVGDLIKEYHTKRQEIKRGGQPRKERRQALAELEVAYVHQIANQVRQLKQQRATKYGGKASPYTEPEDIRTARRSIYGTVFGGRGMVAWK